MLKSLNAFLEWVLNYYAEPESWPLGIRRIFILLLPITGLFYVFSILLFLGLSFIIELFAFLRTIPLWKWIGRMWSDQKGE